jgi:uncharacterized protein YgiM (DUF1202 family)
MINLTSSTPLPPNVGDLRTLSKLVELLSDPVAAKALMADMVSAAAKAEEVIKQAAADMAAVKVEHQKSDAALDAKFQAHTDQMARELAEHQAKLKRESEDSAADRNEAAAFR